jgi:hypothetical protein
MGDRARVLSMINAAWMCQAIAAACELGVADQFAEGPQDIEHLAAKTRANPDALRRLLRGLCTLDLCEERDDGRFALTSDGALLRDGAEDSLHAWARMSGTRIWKQWGQLAESVRTGRSYRQRVLGAEDFSPLDSDPQAAALFNGAMANLTRPVALAAARDLDWSGHRRLVDVGGGPGELLATILSRHPHLNGVVFDLAHALSPARKRLGDAGVADRSEAVEGSFFESVPAGADAYLLKSVLHNWDDARAALILRNCRRAIVPDGRVMLFERIVPEACSNAAGDRDIARSDLNMLVGCDGRERTETQFRELLAGEGFVLETVSPMATALSALVARPA